MTRQPYRHPRAVLVSAGVVLVPAGGSVAVIQLALRTAREGLRVGDPAAVLLAAASLALGGVLVWAAAAAAAGVVDAWTWTAPSAPGLPGGRGVPGPPAGLAAGVPRSRTGRVSAGVAALVVAALTGPAVGAAASQRPPGPVVVTEVVTAQDGEAEPSRARTETTQVQEAPQPQEVRAVTGGPAGAVEAVPAHAAGPVPGPAAPGSWAALAQSGFRAPRGASVGSAALVTGQPSREAAPVVAAEVVVLAGDSLWSIAERHLGPGADATEVAEAWPRWWDANRAVIGDDPHLLLPGQRLLAPAP